MEEQSKNQELKSYAPLPEMRTNKLALIPGGSVVTTVYENYTVNYDNIKNPVSYCSAIIFKSKKKNDIKELYVNGKLYWKREPR
jgi:hypothetical protein